MLSSNICSSQIKSVVLFRNGKIQMPKVSVNEYGIPAVHANRRLVKYGKIKNNKKVRTTAKIFMIIFFFCSGMASLFTFQVAIERSIQLGVEQTKLILIIRENICIGPPKKLDLEESANMKKLAVINTLNSQTNVLNFK